MLANAVLKQLDSVELGNICLWAEKVQNTIVSDLFH